MGWTLGSEERDTTGSNAVPAGMGHAVDVDDQITACGRPVRSLVVWPEIPWRRAGMVDIPRCIGCVAEAD